MRKPSPLEKQSDDIVVIGKLGRPYGVRGWLALQSFTEPMENILTYQPWCMQTRPGTEWLIVENVQAKPHKDAFIAQIDGIEDRDEAARLTGSLIGVSRQAIDVLEEDEYLWHDLIGCQVSNLQGSDVGIVKELMETGAHPVLCITPSLHWQELLDPAPSREQNKAANPTQDPTTQDGGEGQRQKPGMRKAANVLIPFTKAYVQAVDTNNHQIVVDWQADWA
jgi:16S rRNA processing protein RimM